MGIMIAAGWAGTAEREQRLASRKVLRFLDASSLAPFAAAASVYRLAPVFEPADVALYTVSGWDGDMPDQPFVPDGSPADDARLSRAILEDANPVAWLRMLSNNPLCQVSIAEGFRGPNAHLVGEADAAVLALSVAATDLTRAAARQALVVAYDTDPADRYHPSGRAPSRAAALSLVESGGSGVESDVLARLLALAESLAVPGATAVEVLTGCIAELAPVPA